MNTQTKRLLFNFILELSLYGLLLTVYFFVVLRLLGQPLNQLFHLNLWVYAGVTLLLIVVQSVALEFVTSYLLKLLNLETLE